jgi:hypothetical protein
MGKFTKRWRIFGENLCGKRLVFPSELGKFENFGRNIHIKRAFPQNSEKFWWKTRWESNVITQRLITLQ